MTDLDSNAHVEMRAPDMVADLDISPIETIGARQARLAEAMCETFFWQLKLINTAMVELPLGWLRSEAKFTETSSEPAAESSLIIREPAPRPAIAPVEPRPIEQQHVEQQHVEVEPVVQAASPSTAAKTIKSSRKKSSRKKPVS